MGSLGFEDSGSQGARQELHHACILTRSYMPRQADIRNKALRMCGARLYP